MAKTTHIAVILTALLAAPRARALSAGAPRSRRRVLSSVVSSAAATTVAVATPGRVTAGDGVEPSDQAPPRRPAFERLPSGVMYSDIRAGTGERWVGEGDRVNAQWVLKRSNGYFVDSSEKSGGVPFVFTVGDLEGGAIRGVDEGVRGMAVGGIRRILVPPSLGYVRGVEDGKPGPTPVGFGPKQRMRRVMELLKDVPGEYIVVDMKVTRIR